MHYSPGVLFPCFFTRLRMKAQRPNFCQWCTRKSQRLFTVVLETVTEDFEKPCWIPQLRGVYLPSRADLSGSMKVNFGPTVWCLMAAACFGAATPLCKSLLASLSPCCWRGTLSWRGWSRYRVFQDGRSAPGKGSEAIARRGFLGRCTRTRVFAFGSQWGQCWEYSFVAQHGNRVHCAVGSGIL